MFLGLQEIVEIAAPHGEEKVEVITKVIELPTTTHVQNMICNGHPETTVNGVIVQNGLTTTQVFICYFVIVITRQTIFMVHFQMLYTIYPRYFLPKFR